MRLASLSLVVLALLAVGTAHAAPSAVEKQIAAAVDRRMDAALELLAETVNVQSATENLAGVRAVGEIYAREFRALGFETRWVDVPAEMKRAGHLVATHHGKHGGPRFLLIGHLDTVLQGEPFRRDGSRAYGTGSSDMKGGNLVALEALRALQATGELRAMNVTVVFTGDEEDPGSPQLVTRESLLAAAADSDIALAFEGSAPGKAVIGRRGIGSWRLHVTGVQGHSSGIFGETRGYGAIFEAARILDQFRTELREPNLTFNPSVIVGGTNVSYETATKSGTALGKTNVIPREVRVEGDLRYLGAAQFESARARMQAIVAASLPRDVGGNRRRERVSLDGAEPRQRTHPRRPRLGEPRSRRRRPSSPNRRSSAGRVTSLSCAAMDASPASMVSARTARTTTRRVSTCCSTRCRCR